MNEHSSAPASAPASEIAEPARIVFRAALALHEAGQLDEAERGYREALALAPDYADALHNLGVVACQRGCPEDGLASIFAAMNAAPANALCWASFAIALEQCGRFVDAWMVTEEAKGCGLEHADLSAVRGRLESLAAEVERIEREAYGPEGRPATPRADTAVDAPAAAAGTDDATVSADAADASARPGGIRSIADILEATRALHGTPGVARAAVTTRAANVSPAARRHGAGAAVDALPDLLAAGDYPALETAARAAVQSTPRSAVALKALGIALLRQGRGGEAVDPLRRALAVAPREADLHLHLATALVDSGRAKDALASFRRAIALRSRYAEAHALLGNTLLGLDRPDEAVMELRRAAAFEAENAGIHRDLARALERAGRHEESVGPMRRAQQLDPRIVATPLADTAVAPTRISATAA